MTLAEKYFLEFQKQSKLTVTFEGISDTECKIHFDDSGEYYLHTTIKDKSINIKERVANILNSEYYKRAVKRNHG